MPTVGGRGAEIERAVALLEARMQEQAPQLREVQGEERKVEAEGGGIGGRDTEDLDGKRKVGGDS